ncbi:MAG: SLBB domain-containing protein [Gemmatimonadota bacterium]|nr:SLBB domain-containing protein [Gemmatimonadota bacterium]
MNRLSLVFVLLIFLVAPHVLAAQQADSRDPGRAFLSRAELESLGARFRGYAESPAYSQQLRARARAEADLIQARLTDGDFEVGDRVLLIVEGEEAISDTFTVNRGQVLRFGEMGELQLKGVLRSEFEPEMQTHLGRFLREPQTRTQSYLRIAVDGAVSRPGFYMVPADIPMADAVMLAGGPTESAKLSDIRIERGDRRTWSGYPLQEALAGGMTIDQMRLRDGDRIVVPMRRTFTQDTVRTFGLLLGIPLTIAAVIALF